MDATDRPSTDAAVPDTLPARIGTAVPSPRQSGRDSGGRRT